ncbi:hypothetical protein KSF73_13985 [Burkholderiaceae bacterium DAT-1]|nr:hypothetical protein [Burkholderiaceae bacterium DAT-1]
MDLVLDRSAASDVRKGGAAGYGFTVSGTRISPPNGWRILAQGMPVPVIHRLYFDGSGWSGIRRFHSPLTPHAAQLRGRVRGIAVPVP